MLHIIGAGGALGVHVEHQKTVIPVSQGNALGALQGGVQGIRGRGGWVDAINLTEVVAALKEKNKQYATLTEQRVNAKADDPVESAKKIRLRMDEEYDEMSTYAFAQSVVKPTQETAAFISRLNALVDETNALYNQRIAQARAAAAKKQEGDKPATDSDSPSEI